MKKAPSYKKSLEYLQRVEAFIPGGSQTFSKSSLLYPRGHAPHFLERGSGARVWDIDGNEYVDLMAALLAVVLGYCDEDVDRAIRKQLDSGISFSLASRLEGELAEQIIELLPSAEMVRFAKNGSDVTSAAVRIARAATGRQRIIATGYHGWHDWYVGTTTRNAGVPQELAELTHAIDFNDIQALESLLQAYPGEFAAIMIEPVYGEEPAEGYLQTLRRICDEQGIVLVFDEIITGCRVDIGGAQAFYGVTPDLTCLGKALGNGMPIAVLAGKQELMQEFERVFVSGTFNGESLSLAAALAVLQKLKTHAVIENLWQSGQSLRLAMDEISAAHGIDAVIKSRGLAPMQSLQFNSYNDESAEAIQTLFVLNMLEKGVLTIGAINVMYALNERDLSHVLEAFDSTCASIASELQSPGLQQRLPCPLIQQVFQVRKK